MASEEKFDKDIENIKLITSKGDRENESGI